MLVTDPVNTILTISSECIRILDKMQQYMKFGGFYWKSNRMEVWTQDEFVSKNSMDNERSPKRSRGMTHSSAVRRPLEWSRWWIRRIEGGPVDNQENWNSGWEAGKIYRTQTCNGRACIWNFMFVCNRLVQVTIVRWTAPVQRINFRRKGAMRSSNQLPCLQGHWGGDNCGWRDSNSSPWE